MIQLRALSQAIAAATLVATTLVSEENQGNRGGGSAPAGPSRMRASVEATPSSVNPALSRVPSAHMFHATRTRSVILRQPALERCTTQPDELWWRRRDIFREMQSLSRRGLIPVVPVPGDAHTLQDVSEFPSGWKAYGFVVPAHGELEVKLDHANQGWFRLMMVDKWGRQQKGMLQNMIPKGYPVVSFKNTKGEAQEVFVIADDPGWMSNKERPYSLTFTKNWDVTKVDLKPIPSTVGIWAKQGTVKPTPAATEAGAGPSKSR